MLRFHLSTIVFQLVNFAALLAALTWFLYRPLLRVMRQREEEIRTHLDAAEERARAAEAERQQLAEERRRAQADAEVLMADARGDAARQRAQMLEDARQEAAKLLDDTGRRIEEEERAARRLLEAEVRQTAVSLAAGLIERIPVKPLHEALVADLLDRGLAEEGEHAALLRRALATHGRAVCVELALPPGSELESRVRRRLDEAWGRRDGDVAVTFRVEPALVAGARILAGTVAVELSLAGVLAELERRPDGEGAIT